MALFEAAQTRRSNQWKDLSFDFKLMFVYHGCMMILFMTGGSFSVRQEILFAGALLLLLGSISSRHRRAKGWHWQGASAKNRLAALGGLVLMGFFLYAGTPLFPPSDHRFMPWYLAGFGIGLFGFLQSLRLVHTTEAAFLADCGEPSTQAAEPVHSEPTGPRWQRVARTIYSIAFFLVWLEFLAFFYYSGKTFRDGSPVPTQTQTEPMTEHGKTVYVRRDQKAISDELERLGFIGIPTVLVSGLLLHFVVGVKIFENRGKWE
jgi:hypothetical protein